LATSIKPLRAAPPGPPLPVSLRSTRELTTGTGRAFRPQFERRESPCNLDCPAGTDVRAFLAFAAAGDAKSAWHTIREHNPLPGVCGRVCYHSCESQCNRAPMDGSVSVHAVERAIADEARARRLRPKSSPIVLPPRLVAIVGSGPAGLSAAHHLARRGCGVTVFDEMPRPGGMLRYGIPAYRLPRQVLDAEIALLHQMGVHFVCRTKVGPEIGALGSFDAVFVAVGLWQSVNVGVKGQNLPGVRPGLGFLKEVNNGAAEGMSGPVVVIGGGNTALDAARASLRLGGEVTVVYRRGKEDMPAHPDEIEHAEREGVRMVFHATPARFVERNGRLAEVEFQRVRAGAADATGRGGPQPIPGSTFTLPAAIALTAVGEDLEREAVTSLLNGTAAGLPFDSWGRTSLPTIFAGGDAATGLGTVVEAIGSGRRAAEAMSAMFRGEEPADNVRGERITVEGLNLFYFPSAPRTVQRRQAVTDGPVRTFDEIDGGLNWAQAQGEALRCFSCGSCTHCDNCVTFCPDTSVSRDPATGEYLIDLTHCKGCGLCATECPTGALTLQPEIAG
jgi:NADPH-dependent glutamate synthase beta subunit-like oxidoreductase